MAISDQTQGEKEKEVKESTPPTGTHNQFTPAEADPTPTQEEDNPQGTEERKGPSYTEKLSATAAAAKSAAAGSTEYGKKIASTVYEKVAEAGTAVKAKVQQKPSGTTGTEGGERKQPRPTSPTCGYSPHSIASNRSGLIWTV